MFVCDGCKRAVREGQDKNAVANLFNAKIYCSKRCEKRSITAKVTRDE